MKRSTTRTKKVIKVILFLTITEYKYQIFSTLMRTITWKLKADLFP